MQRASNSPTTPNDRGVAAAQSGNFTGARSYFEEAIVAAPASPAAHNNLGNVARRLGDFVLAEKELRTAVCLAPEEADYHLNLAHFLRQTRRVAEAVIAAEHTIRLDGQRTEALRLRAELLTGLQRNDVAILAWRALLAIVPHDAPALNELGNLLQSVGQLREAEECYRRSSEADARIVAPVANRARLMADRGEWEASRCLLQKAATANRSPQLRIAAATTLPVIVPSIQQITLCRRQLADELRVLAADGCRIDPTRTVLPNLFYLAYHGENDRDLMSALAGLLTPVERRAQQWPEPQPTGARRLRVGFLSKYLCDHTVGRLNLGFVEQLSREKFEIVVFPVGQADDAIARRYRSAADHVVPLPDDLGVALDCLAQARLDILFFPDRGMDPFTLTLAASRVAPRQVMTWGHPVTTGLATIDAFLSTTAEVPEADRHYSERLIRLPRLGVMMAKPEFPKPPDRAAFGLPDGANLYGCPQTLFKFHPDFDELLCRILQADPKGRIVLLEGQHPSWTEQLTARFRRSMPDVADRVTWLPRLARDEFRQLVSTCDVLLDPPHFGGGHTSYESFACGVPVVTLPSRFLRGRLTLAMLQQMGVEELVAADANSYVEIALRVGMDASPRSSIRRHLLQRNAELFEDRAALTAFESALEDLRS